MSQLHQITVVIRSVYERTEQLCRKLVIDQGVPEKNVYLIHEKPFSRAMEVSYRLGLENNLKWTYCLDADVLLRNGAINDLLQVANRESDLVFGLSGKALDKLMGIERSVGNHLFRTSFLEKMISHIEDYEDEQIRPEYHVKKIMRKHGYKWQRKKILMGLHDYEQHYHDIARKAFVHAHKFSSKVGELIPYWMDRAEHDPDFKAALFGLSRGICHFDEVRINVDEFAELQIVIDKHFKTKSNDFSAFTFNHFGAIEEELKKSRGEILWSAELKEKYENIFVRKFMEKSYIELFSHLKNKMVRKIKKIIVLIFNSRSI